MFEICEFCQVQQVAEKAKIYVQDLIFYTNSGHVKFTEILEVSLGFAANLSMICERCVDTVLKFYSFKDNLVNQNSTNARKSQIKKNVNKFLEEQDESVSVIEQNRCLCLVPESELDKFNLPNSSLCSLIEVEPEQVYSEDLLQNIAVVTELKKLVKEEEVTNVQYFEEQFQVLDEQKPRKTRSKKRNRLKPKDYRLRYLFDHKLNRKQRNWINQQVSSSKLSKNLFECTQCQKKLKSKHACRYHIYSKHVKEHDASKVWIARKIKEGETRSSKGQRSYHCVFCFKTYPSSDGLRYHLKFHLNEEFETLKTNK